MTIAAIDDAQAVRVESFAPLSDASATTLILGSMPGNESLRIGQYYGNPRNAFWPIMADLLGIDPRGAYPDRVAALAARGIAVWDVLCSCVRPGSLDSAIDPLSIQTNDFLGFYQRHPGIGRVFFNGAFAETTYLRRVLPTLTTAQAGIAYRRLPSTSPANASHRYQAKREAWRAVTEAS